MDAAQVLRELWRRKAWLAGAVVGALVVSAFVAYRVSFTPVPKLESKSFEYGSATTEVILDAPFAPLIDVRSDLEPLAIRAQVYSRLMRSPEVLVGVAERLGIPAGSITALAAGAGQQEERSARLIAEDREFRLATRSESGLPVVTVFAQAPSAKEAVAFADGVVTEFAGFLAAQPTAGKVPRDVRVQLRPLGPAQGGVVNEGADKTMVALAFVGAFLAGCFLIVTVSGIANGWQVLSRADQARPVPAEDHNAPVAPHVPLHVDKPHDDGISSDHEASAKVLEVPRGVRPG